MPGWTEIMNEMQRQDDKSKYLLEHVQDLQEAVLSLHHCLMILMDIAPILKFVTNQEGRLYLQTKSKEEK